jgi:hypothetical protein
MGTVALTDTSTPRRAAHVRRHQVHAGRRLDRDAAGVEGDALPYECYRLGVLGAGVRQADQPRFAGAALAHADDSAVALLFQCGVVEDFDGEAVLASHCGRACRELLRVEVAGRGVDEVPGDRDGVGDDHRVGELRLGVGVAGLHQEVHLGRHRDRVGLLRVAGIGAEQLEPV